jgi:prophage regulatory protein
MAHVLETHETPTMEPYMFDDVILSSLRILRRPQVEAITGLSRSSIYQRMRDGTFPNAIQLGARSVGWRAADIEAFLAAPAGYQVTPG